jgi:hypothetical protein
VLLSHPNLRTKSDEESYVYLGINHTHKMTNYIVSSSEFITYRMIIHTLEQINYQSNENSNSKLQVKPPNSTGTVDW